MKNWFKEYRKNIIFSMLLTLLPMFIGLLLWNRLPDVMTSHWGADGVADGTASKAFMVFAVPAILAGLNLLCILATALDPKQAGQNKKAMRVVFWIMPLICIAVMSSAYAIALGKATDVFVLMPLLLGVMFVAIGNYMPKVQQNTRLGIKISWTLHNEENWNKTHRFAGKIWVIGGIFVMLSALLPTKWMIFVTIPMLFLLALVPMGYSYCIYRRHKQQGIEYKAAPATKADKVAKRGSIVGVVVVLVVVAVLMFTGDITYTVTDSALQIEATYHSDALVSYDQIDTIELRQDFDIGYRAMGFNSAKLSLGTYQNEEFGSFTLYAYNACDSMIVLRSNGKVLAFNCATEQDTQALYEHLLTKCSKP
jgi:uncharacterized membrane protein